MCRTCANREHVAAWRARNPELARARQRQYNETYQDKQAAQQQVIEMQQRPHTTDHTGSAEFFKQRLKH